MEKATRFFKHLILNPNLLNIAVGCCIDGSIDDIQNILEDLDHMGIFPGIANLDPEEDNELNRILTILFNHYEDACIKWTNDGWLDGSPNRAKFELAMYGKIFKNHNEAYSWGIGIIAKEAQNFK